MADGWRYPGALGETSFTSGPTTSGWQPHNYPYGNGITADADGTITDIQVRADGNGSTLAGKIAIFNNSGTLLGSGTFTYPASVAWVGATGLSVSVSSGQTYHILAVCQDEWARYWYNTGDAGDYGATAYASFPPSTETIGSDPALGYGARMYLVEGGGTTNKSGSDTPSVSVTEGKTLLSTSSRTDTPTVSLTEAAALLGLPSVADSPAVSLTEASSLLIAIPGTDTPSVSVTEAKTLVSTSDLADTPTISVVESATVFKDIAVSDTPTLTLTEGSTVVGPVTQQTGADTPTISLTEASSVFSQTLIDDTPSVSVVEAQTSLVTSAIADTPTISLVELSAILASRTRTDTVSISLLESSSKVTIDGFSGTDAPALTLVEVAQLAQYDGDWIPEDPGVPGWGEEGSISDPWTIEPSTTSPWS